MNAYYVRIKGDVLVKVPPGPSHISTWVLMEQEDWFEKEINFVRRLLKPGMRVVDVGANVGVYALTMAKLVAPDGAVWAFEPAPEPSAMLRHSIERNRFRNLRLMQMALSASIGRAVLQLNCQSELNSLVCTDATNGVGTLDVAVSTLDCQQAELDWGQIDFIKIDAEGAELDIIAGGKRFFGEKSPLVMFEVDHSRSGKDTHTTQQAFRTLGFDIYRLIGPDVMLVPFAPDETVREFDINLFACKPDRAARLAAAGLLASAPRSLAAFPEGGGQALAAALAYATAFGALGLNDGIYRRALDAYAVWRDNRAAPNLRYAALAEAFRGAQEAVADKPSGARLATLARFAIEAGERRCAIDTLWRAITLFQRGTKLPDEPFFPPARRYEAIDPLDVAHDWFVAASIEAWEELRCFSGYFIPAQAQCLDMLDWLQSTQFASAPMERRRQLQRWLAGVQSGLQALPILSREAPDHLNPALWITG